MEICSHGLVKGSPGVSGLILFGCVIEEAVAAEYFFPGLGVDAIIESNKYPTVCDGYWYGLSDRVPESIPWDFR